MGLISFARGVPAPECLPVDELADCARAAIEGGGPAVLSYGPGGGYAPLRDWIADRHGVEAERVVLTNGSLQGLGFLAELLAPGKRVLVEAPTYDRPLRILARVGAEAVPVPIDGEGLDPDGLEQALREGPPPAFLYTIPTFQNPSGRTLSLERRRRALELARRYGLLVVEDDPYGLVSFDGAPPPTLYELAGGEGVVHSSSFSKTIAPGVRVGWLVLPRELAAELEARAVSTYISPPSLTQATVFEFLRRGNFEPNLERVRGLLRARRDAMLDALERHFAGGLCRGWSQPGGGYFVWLDLAEVVDAADLLERGEREGVAFVKGADFFPGGAGGRSSARLAFSFVSPEEIAEGVVRLAAAAVAAAPAVAAAGSSRPA
ncbi:MAG TPA: PLP-dependent aminotransferase family protein [Gaiellaceae bacterium]|jgi:DNA-binding transcriptional MocR family regulator|nr:PLP-dependent aminotransferase family protein [Gaiellaceae bacterium]